MNNTDTIQKMAEHLNFSIIRYRTPTDILRTIARIEKGHLHLTTSITRYLGVRQNAPQNLLQDYSKYLSDCHTLCCTEEEILTAIMKARINKLLPHYSLLPTNA